MEWQRQPARPSAPVNRASSNPDLRHRFRASTDAPQPPVSRRVKTMPIELPKDKKQKAFKGLRAFSGRSSSSKPKILKIVLPTDKPSLDKLSDSAYRANDRIEEAMGKAHHYAKTYVWWIAGASAVILSGVLIGIIISSYSGLKGQQNSGAAAFPDSVSRELLMPDGDTYKLDIKTVKHTKDTGVISYSVELIGGASVLVNQQPYPKSFIDDPKAFPQMLVSMNSYGEVSVKQDKAYLTRPAELKGGQAVVSKAGKHLLFIKPSKDFTPNEVVEFIADLKTTSYNFPK